MSVLILAAGPIRAGERTFPLPDRLAARRAVEEALWSARTWPESNPGPKPALDEVLPPDRLRRLVEEDVAKTTALAATWHRAFTASDLWAEVERMARESRDAALLARMFHALGDDPLSVVETLARPELVDREIRTQYAWDARLHAAERERADAALAGGGDLRTRGDAYVETTFVLAGDAGMQDGGTRDAGTRDVGTRDGSTDDGSTPDAGTRADGTPRITNIDAAALAALEARAGRGEDLSRAIVREDEHGFSIESIVAREGDAVRVGTVRIDKRPFADWWAETREQFLPAPSDVGPALAGEIPDALPALAATACADGTLYHLGDDVPVARSRHTAVWTGSEMIVWGGRNESVSGLATGGRYRPATNSWADFPPITSPGSAPSARYGHTAVWSGTWMIVWAGTTDSALSPNNAWLYDPVENTFETPTIVSGTAPAARYEHTAVWTGQQMIVFGGRTLAGTALSDAAAFDPAARTWTALPAGPSARYGHTAVSTGTTMIVWGGYNGTTYLSDGMSWNGTSWRGLPTTGAPSARARHAAHWSTKGVMTIWGGQNAAGVLNTGATFNLKREEWNATPTDGAPAARAWHTAAGGANELIVWGGQNAAGTALASGGRYSMADARWLSLPTVSAARTMHTAVWTGSEMVVWGGTASNVAMNTGVRYTPGDAFYTATSTSTGRPDTIDSALWTGAEIVAHRGEARWFPSTARWQAMPAYPYPDYGMQSLVWTGTEVIAWGGGDGMLQALNTGARYSPVTDAWTPTSTGANVPLARWGHSAVWSGTAMIVWGGRGSGTGYVANGARYTPSTDTWATIGWSASQPSARIQQTAVWTGSEMIVWGGSAGADGSAYAPATDAWRKLPFAPLAPRVDHTAVWTGSEMIVWGGAGGSTVFGDGARYSPTFNRWVYVSGEPASYPHTRHVAVWTGREMILWGGYANAAQTQFQVVGQRLEPGFADLAPFAAEPRVAHSAVWTGTDVIVLGGGSDNPYVNNSGDTATGYCVSCAQTPFCLDADTDFYGDPARPSAQCWVHAGFATTCDDCNDLDPLIHPGVPDATCDGIDQNCNGVLDDAFPAPSGVPSLTLTGRATTTLAWTVLAGATSSDVVRGQLATLATGFASSTAACVADNRTTTSVTDATMPSPGVGLWYLVRGVNCHTGGTYDDGSQSGSRDAGIAASAGECP